MPSVVLATGGYDNRIRLWEAPSGVCYQSYQFQDSHINKLAVTSDKKMLAAAGCPNIKLFEVNSTAPAGFASYEGHKSNVVTVGFWRDEKRMYSAGEDGSAKVWDLRATKNQTSFNINEPITSATLHPNQVHIFIGDQSGRITVWDVRSSKPLKELHPDDKAVGSLSISSDGSFFAAASQSGYVSIWRMNTPEDYGSPIFHPLVKFRAHDRYILNCAFSPDCTMLATTSADHTTKIWLRADKETDESGQEGEGGEETFNYWRSLIGHQRWVWDCAFSTDSEYIVTASSDHTARLWDLKKGETVRQYTGHSKAVTSVTLNDAALEN
mmetsp:Transcript_29857/g.77064  ORF Transcript_29857/g.77064 Transcript_29857/m.77064 type:complete len:325 (-) Transcript_29857:277-1251(-)|eukprot:CAMPEP_0113885712 /NCGR_PEP_ID=MMETSP0780_2-20120614/11081_1 /TAXON_ID=652834 /ORGANISM="Palpitomonas bilix" /LENGTH=324 /DNA_ID=CAMNT_0000873705 /DNA_START=285 /DNA_END=1259 /DNA_ORIENTATION=- /assembly_acc=CAM_ASM_000599